MAECPGLVQINEKVYAVSSNDPFRFRYPLIGYMPDAIRVDKTHDFFYEASRRPDLSLKKELCSDGSIAAFLFAPDRSFILYPQCTVPYFM